MRWSFFLVMGLVAALAIPCAAHAQESGNRACQFLADIDAPVEYGPGALSLGLDCEWRVHRAFFMGAMLFPGHPVARDPQFRPFTELYWSMSGSHADWSFGLQLGMGVRYDGSGGDGYFAQWAYAYMTRPIGPHLSIYTTESPTFLGGQNAGEWFFRFRPGIKIDIPGRTDLFVVPALDIMWADLAHRPYGVGWGVAFAIFKNF